MSGGTEFRRGKLKELVLYLAQTSADDEGFGMVKLNKLLYLADFEAYRLLGHSITGETYEKQEYGPVARHLPIVLDDLAASGYLTWHRVPRGPYVRKVPEATEAPDLSMFSKAELMIVDRSLEALAGHGGWSVSQWSHEQSAGWNVAKETGDEIDYGTAFVSTAPIPDQDLQRARQFVHEQGWVTT